MIIVINTTKTIIFQIVEIIIRIVINHEEKNVIFVAKKVVVLIKIQNMSKKNKRILKTKPRTKQIQSIFWLIIKKIQMMILMI